MNKFYNIILLLEWENTDNVTETDLCPTNSGLYIGPVGTTRTGNHALYWNSSTCEITGGGGTTKYYSRTTKFNK